MHKAAEITEGLGAAAKHSEAVDSSWVERCKYSAELQLCCKSRQVATLSRTP